MLTAVTWNVFGQKGGLGLAFLTVVSSSSCRQMLKWWVVAPFSLHSYSALWAFVLVLPVKINEEISSNIKV
jgi:hypothetical protein